MTRDKVVRCQSREDVGSRLSSLIARPELFRYRQLWGRLVARVRSKLIGLRTVQELREFLGTQNPATQLRFLTSIDVGRLLSVMDFARYLSDQEFLPQRVAVVSGSFDEPELVLLDERSHVLILSFDDNPDLFDLTKDWRGEKWAHLRGAFDLVFCEQVLEHTPDPARAFNNLAKLLKPNGFLHFSVPAVNNRHGEPYYFFSGFSSEIIELWLEQASFDVDLIRSWNSDKGSRMYSTSDWAPLAVCGPVVFFWMAAWLLRTSPSRLGALALSRVRNFLTYPFQPLFSGLDRKNSVVLWGVARPGFSRRL